MAPYGFSLQTHRNNLCTERTHTQTHTHTHCPLFTKLIAQHIAVPSKQYLFNQTSILIEVFHIITLLAKTKKKLYFQFRKYYHISTQCSGKNVGILCLWKHLTLDTVTALFTETLNTNILHSAGKCWDATCAWIHILTH